MKAGSPEHAKHGNTATNIGWMMGLIKMGSISGGLGPLSDTTVERAVAILVVSSLGPSRARSAS